MLSVDHGRCRLAERLQEGAEILPVRPVLVADQAGCAADTSLGRAVDGLCQRRCGDAIGATRWGENRQIQLAFCVSNAGAQRPRRYAGKRPDLHGRVDTDSSESGVVERAYTVVGVLS